MWYSSHFHPKYPKIVENRKKRWTIVQENFFWAMSWISLEIHLSHMNFDEDHESVNNFDHSSIVEELSVYFRCTSGKFEFSNCLKVKSELCSPQSFYQFKHSLSKEEVFYL
jgi:hypothetical protein